MISLRTWQITVGFDVAVTPEEVAEVLATRFGRAQIGQGVSENGIPTRFIHVENGTTHEQR
jgi:hypothetical protein